MRIAKAQDKWSPGRGKQQQQQQQQRQQHEQQQKERDQLADKLSKKTGPVGKQPAEAAAGQPGALRDKGWERQGAARDHDGNKSSRCSHRSSSRSSRSRSPKRSKTKPSSGVERNNIDSTGRSAGSDRSRSKERSSDRRGSRHDSGKKSSADKAFNSRCKENQRDASSWRRRSRRSRSYSRSPDALRDQERGVTAAARAGQYNDDCSTRGDGSGCANRYRSSELPHGDDLLHSGGQRSSRNMTAKRPDSSNQQLNQQQQPQGGHDDDKAQQHDGGAAQAARKQFPLSQEELRRRRDALRAVKLKRATQILADKEAAAAAEGVAAMPVHEPSVDAGRAVSHQAAAAPSESAEARVNVNGRLVLTINKAGKSPAVVRKPAVAVSRDTAAAAAVAGGQGGQSGSEQAQVHAGVAPLELAQAAAQHTVPHYYDQQQQRQQQQQQLYGTAYQHQHPVPGGYWPQGAYGMSQCMPHGTAHGALQQGLATASGSHLWEGAASQAWQQQQQWWLQQQWWSQQQQQHQQQQTAPYFLPEQVRPWRCLHTEHSCVTSLDWVTLQLMTVSPQHHDG
jgi:hypothetical protein